MLPEEKVYIKNVWKKLDTRYLLIKSFLELKISDDKLKDLNFTRNRLAYYLKDASFESRLGIVYLAHKLNNMGLVYQTISDIIKTPLEVEIASKTYPYFKKQEVQKKVIEILNYILNQIPFSKQLSLFKLKVQLDLNKEMRSMGDISQKIIIPSELKSSVVYGPYKLISVFPTYFNCWVKWFKNESPKSLLDEKFQTYNIALVDNRELIALKYYYLDYPRYRKKVTKRLIELKNSKNLTENIVFFEILANKSWQNYLIAKFPSFSMDLIKLKRKVFSKALISRWPESTGVLSSYFVYELFKLGDYNRKYFIHLLALKSYGLLSA